MTRTIRLPLACLCASLALLAGCGGDEDPPASAVDPATEQHADCTSAGDSELRAAVREHGGKLDVKTATTEGTADAVEVEACITSGAAARGTVTVFGVRDDSVSDARHELELRRARGRWQITADVHTYRCRQGRGHQDFAAEPCV